MHEHSDVTLFWDIRRSHLFRNLQHIYISSMTDLRMVTLHSDDVCVLSVTGTAAIINLMFTSGEIGVLNTALTSAASKAASGGGDCERNDNGDGSLKKNSPPKIQFSSNGGKLALLKHSKSIDNNPATVLSEKNSSANSEVIDCSICHIPYSRTSVPFNEHMKKCLVCKYEHLNICI